MAMGAGFTLRELARALHATLEGDAAAVVIGVAPLESAGPDQISFLVDARYVEAAKASRAGAFLAGPEVSGLPAPVLRVPAPQQALIELLTLFHPPAEAVAGVAPSAVVARDASVAPTATVGALAVIESGAVIGPHVRIGPLAFVGAGAEVGEASVVHARVAVCARVRLGKRVVVHPGAVIGADGFGYAFDGEAHRKIPQVGSVVVEDDVEIGEHSIIVAQVGISGSCRVGRGVVLAGQVGVADHLTIGDGAVVAAQSGLARDVAPGEKVFGTPARPLIEAKRIFVLEGELPELARRLRSAERRLAQLEARLGAGGA